jgi:hypothetical protein
VYKGVHTRAANLRNVQHLECANPNMTTLTCDQGAWDQPAVDVTPGHCCLQYMYGLLLHCVAR